VRTIMFDPLPRIYDMSWQGQTASLELGINTKILEEVFKDAKDWGIIKHLQENHKVGELTADPNIGFGFDPCRLMRRGTRGDHAIFSLHLPEIEVVIGVCQECEGKSKRKRRDCLYCGNTGKERGYQHHQGTVAAINLNLLLSKLSFPELQEIETRGNQLMMINLAVADRSLHGYPLWAAFSPQMVKWIGMHEQQTDLPLVRGAMKEAMVRMMPSYAAENDFRAWLEPDGVFNFRVPGNCACLSPDYTARECLMQDRGYDFGTHNVDTPAQQLSLLAGLSYLWEMARKDLYKES
jgi:hypothetical protein